MSVSPNLATRPFRNQRLPRLVLGLAWVALLALSAAHALAAFRLLQQRSSGRVEEAAQLEAKLRRVTSQASSAAPQADPEQLKLWAALKQLVDLRAFSWTGLLANLEQVLPAGARIVSLAPKAAGDRLEIDLEFAARTHQDSLELLRTLEARPEFSEVYPLQVDDADGVRKVRCRMVYDPSAAPEPEPEGSEAPSLADGAQA